MPPKHFLVKQTYIGKIFKFSSNEQKWSVKLEHNVVWLPAVPPYLLVSYICSSGHVLLTKHGLTMRATTDGFDRGLSLENLKIFHASIDACAQ